jgi:hypothetical protein
MVESIKKIPVICSLDPAFKHLGVCVINSEYTIIHTENYSFVPEDYKK